MPLDLQKALAEWQEALRLQDWDIKAEILPDIEFRERTNEPKSTWGISDKDTTHFRAEILLNDNFGDKEHTLVHKLVHILLVEYDLAFGQAIGLVAGENCKQALEECRKWELEKATNRITRALLKVRDMAQEVREK